MARASLTFILPAFSSLLSSSLNHSAQPASLKKIIAKSLFSNTDDSLEKILFQCFYPELALGSDLPVARLRGSGQAELCADPCYVIADQGRLRLFHRDLKLSQQEVDQVIQALQPLFAERQAKLSAHTSRQWLVQCTDEPRLTCSALTELEGKSVLEHLPSGPDAAEWISLWNEAQMLLFDLPMNQQREAEGKLPVNSVWFWGTGDLLPSENMWQETIGEHPLLDALAEQTKTSHRHQYVDTNLISRLPGNTLVLVAELDWQHDWQRQLNDYEELVFQPLWQAVRRGRISELTIAVPEWGQYVITPWQSWKFWK